MAKRPDLMSLNHSETVIGAGVRAKGTLASDGDISIDGQLTGEIKTTGDVMLGVNAVVKANISARNVTVAGQLKGHIKATGDAAITETGKVVGNINCQGLAISAGAVFVGASIMTETTVRELPDEETPDLGSAPEA